MSPRLESVLRDAGWYPQRKVSASDWIEPLRSYGFEIVPEAQAILEMMGGLTIRPVKAPTDAYSPGVVILEPLRCAEQDRVAYWQQRLGILLTPIGEIGGQACLLIAEDGSVYTSWDRFLFKNGYSFEDALENTLVFAKRKPLELPSEQ